MGNSVQRARELAIRHHAGQLDKIGLDYFVSHVEPVARMTREWGGSEVQVTAAYLHDLVEDTPITMEYIEQHFSDHAARIVQHLTKPTGWSYREFIRFVTVHPPAVLVKIADITSNMDPARLFYLDPDKRERLVSKYTDALPVLWANYQGR